MQSHAVRGAMITKWAYGVTTVPQRKGDLLPKTLRSLVDAGFDKSRLFVDGAKEGFDSFGLDVTYRYPRIRTYGNWVLSLAELYIREPGAQLYAVFQDDVVFCRNIRQYLERSSYPAMGYWNLYTVPANQKLVPPGTQGWYRSNQHGRGALALVFSRDTVLTLLTHQHMVERPLDSMRGWRTVDGGIVTAMKKAGHSEYVHNPSLVQHAGDYSTMRSPIHKKATSFKGSEFDALTLLG